MLTFLLLFCEPPEQKTFSFCCLLCSFLDLRMAGMSLSYSSQLIHHLVREAATDHLKCGCPPLSCFLLPLCLQCTYLYLICSCLFVSLLLVMALLVYELPQSSHLFSFIHCFISSLGPMVSTQYVFIVLNEHICFICCPHIPNPA